MVTVNYVFCVQNEKSDMNINHKNTEIKKVYDLLMTNEKFLKFFIEEPEKAIQKFNLEEEEKRTLLVRHVDELPALGIEKAPPCGIREEEW